MSRDIDLDLSVPTPCGPLLRTIDLPLTDGTSFQWTCVHPGATLSWLASSSEHFDKTLASLHNARPSSPSAPWRLALYADEANVGNLLRSDATREAWLVYWGLLDFGPQVLSHENNWMLVGLLRSKVCKKVKGGISGVFRAALSNLFFGPESNFQQAGFLVKRMDGSLIGPIFCRLGFILGDDDALTRIWRTKGAMGNLNCLHCKNVCRTTSLLAQHDATG